MTPAMLFDILEKLPSLDELNEHLNCRLCFKPQIKAMIKRVTDLTVELDSKIGEDEFRCSIDPFYVPHNDPGFSEFNQLRQIYDNHTLEVSGVNTKHNCKIPTTSANGFKKEGFDKHVSNPKNRIRIDRSKIRVGKG